MENRALAKRTVDLRMQENFLPSVIESFLIDRKIQNLSPGTIHFYEQKFQLLTKYCDTLAVTEILQIDAVVLRGYLSWLEETGHNPGGQHAAYRAVKTLLRWWSNETDPQNWKDPTKKVKAPKLEENALDPVPIESVRALLTTCRSGIIGLRDKALIMFLLDTGCRAHEALTVQYGDIDILSGAVFVRHGKGRKTRTVFVGDKTKKAIRKYLVNRNDDNPGLWLSTSGKPLTYWGLRDMMERRSKLAKITTPEIHAFRRAFALSMLRSGENIYTIQHLLGHADLQVLRRYLKQTTEDLHSAHRRSSPGDMI